MRNISLIAAIGATSTTQARVNVPAGAQINPLQITMSGRHLPVAHYDDYSLEYAPDALPDCAN